ncbi:MAG: helix-turn-helix domain-containing protein [Parcubacteria group bacterium]|jgi:transcriptional regulator with XRE-family HTH domain
MVKNGFVKKNVGTLTLGERLSKIRSEKRITLSEVSKSTRIQMKYLEYLESGRYEKLPVDVYVKGFLRSYAQYLGADENYFIKLYEREREIHNNIKKEESEKKIFKPIKFSGFSVTPKIIIAVLIVFFIGLGFFYLYRELSIFISKPRLVIIEPLDNFSIENKMIKIEGITEKDSKLLINGQSIIVDENGKFSEVLVLQPGLNKISVKSINRFDKESEKIITGEAKFENITEEGGENSPDPQNQDDQPSNEENKEIKIKADVYGSTKPASIIIKADDVEIFNGKISPGEVKNFEAQNKISVSADKGKYVGVKINGKDLGTLSKDTKPVDNRIFTSPK